ncbi:NAD(P)-dependent oxidoreductase [Nocardia noduli]|uniref:NAD(P)-dependent oxidoreductase n=1 Tax=Nocardia noduli TaxID=2815722 RepID=UPI001C24CF44|nr:NAD(P)-binding domain-containing protein [Nocardia noduli]
MAEILHDGVTVLGLGAMGHALAGALVASGRPTTVWNRTPGRGDDLIEVGAIGAPSVAEAVGVNDLVIAVLLDHASVHETLDPVVARLRGRQLINLTSTAPEHARELARWAAANGVGYLDGGIMAVPSMIGQPGASILYSGDRAVFESNRSLLESVAAVEFLGEDPGLASTYDFALLSVMYSMFAGFFHGAAMVRSVGVSAAEFAERASGWVRAMAHGLPEYGRTIDSGDYTTDVQHLGFQKAALDAIVTASRDAGIALDVIAPVKNLIDRQVADGHGDLAFARTFEELR